MIFLQIIAIFFFKEHGLKFLFHKQGRHCRLSKNVLPTFIKLVKNITINQINHLKCLNQIGYLYQILRIPNKVKTTRQGRKPKICSAQIETIVMEISRSRLCHKVIGCRPLFYIKITHHPFTLEYNSISKSIKILLYFLHYSAQRLLQTHKYTDA